MTAPAPQPFEMCSRREACPELIEHRTRLTVVELTAARIEKQLDRLFWVILTAALTSAGSLGLLMLKGKP